jgi:hypothetical protein
MTQKTFECYPVKLDSWNSKAPNWLFQRIRKSTAVLQQLSLYLRHEELHGSIRIVLTSSTWNMLPAAVASYPYGENQFLAFHLAYWTSRLVMDTRNSGLDFSSGSIS